MRLLILSSFLKDAIKQKSKQGQILYTNTTSEQHPPNPPNNVAEKCFLKTLRDHFEYMYALGNEFQAILGTFYFFKYKTR